MIITTDMRDASDLLSAVAHPARLSLVHMLVAAGQSGLTVGEIARALAISQSALSAHLRGLETAGLVRRVQQSTRISFRMRRSGVRRLDSALTTTLRLLGTDGSSLGRDG